MQVDTKMPPPTETMMSEQLVFPNDTTAAVADGAEIVHDPYEESPLLDNNNSNLDDADNDGPALLWTMDEETVLLHSSEASLRHIRTRLEHLLLGVSHALRTREVRGDSQDAHDGRVSANGSARRSHSRPALDFAESVLAADHALRRIMGEAFTAYEEDEVVQMAQLCSLADRGPADCDELARNAVVVLQALTHDGEAVRSVEHFREFVETHRAEMAGEQWRHDYVTAMRSLAVGFLRQPVAIMASYGSSLNSIVEHEALYIGLLRLCGGRPIGNTPHPKELPATLDEALLTLHQGTPATHPAQKSAPAAAAATKVDSAKPRTPPASAARHSATYIHTPKNSSKRTHARRSSVALQQPTLPSAEDLQAAIGLLLSSGPSSPSTPLKKANTPQHSAAGPTPSQLHDLQKSVSHSDSAVASERRASASHARTEKSKPAYDPVPEVPQRLSLHHRGRGPSMSHY